MKTHLAARETFAIDGIPACAARLSRGDITSTHTLALVTCASCRKTREFKRAESMGLHDNDETWNDKKKEGM